MSEETQPQDAQGFWGSAEARTQAMREGLAPQPRTQPFAGDGLEASGLALNATEGGGGQQSDPLMALIVFAANGELATGYADVQNIRQVST